MITDYIPDVEIDPRLPLNFEPIVHTQAQSYQKYPIVIFEDGRYKLKQFEWGIIAPYMNTPEKIKKQRPQMCNARSEKLADRSSFWYRIKSTPCLIPVTGIFEHREISGWKTKVPYHVSLKNRSMFCLPGLYHYPNRADVETGEITGTFTIITRPANEVMKQIHNSGDAAGRMPLFLPKEKELVWLQPGLSKEVETDILDFEMPSEALNYHPVYTIRSNKARPDNLEKTEAFKWEGLPTLGIDNGAPTLF